MFLALLIEH
jgi:hypothetical protein